MSAVTQAKNLVHERPVMKFRVRAQWTGPEGRQMGIADDTVEGKDACDIFDAAMPSEWRDGEFTGATVTIEKISD